MSGNQWQSVAVGEALAYSLEGPPSQSVPLSFVTRLLPRGTTLAISATQFRHSPAPLRTTLANWTLKLESTFS
jgi:hypothetical protein